MGLCKDILNTLDKGHHGRRVRGISRHGGDLSKVVKFTLETRITSPPSEGRETLARTSSETHAWILKQTLARVSTGMHAWVSGASL